MSMKIVKPHSLRRGDVIGICAPASAPSTDDAIDKGIRYLEHLGYRIELGKNVYRRRGYLAGTDDQRASDVNTLFANPNIKAVFTVRGGYGSHRILPLLNYSTIKRNPKIFVGYSDITALQLAFFTKTGLITFSGPMVASEMSAGLRGNEEELFWRTLTSHKPLPPIDARRSFSTKHSSRKNRSVGRLLGGNLSLVAALVGTPYFRAMSKLILLLEEIDERPYRIDRLLQQIKLAGVLKKINGVVLGKFIGCEPQKGKSSLTLEQVLDETFSDFRYPVLSSIHYGHVKRSLTLPLGVRVQVDARSGRLSFLESHFG
jgi:muramoyltetrapeptide carboxypeptidase